MAITLSPQDYVEEKIRVHAERCRDSDGVYRLAQDEDVILISRP